MRGGVIVMALALGLSSFLAQGSVVHAHERWFVKEGQHAGERIPMDMISLVVIAGAILLMTLAFAVSRSALSRRLEGLFNRLQRSSPQGVEWRVVAMLAGIVLVANALSGVFLAANLVLPDNMIVVGSVAQALIGVVLFSQVSFVIPGVLILMVALPLAIIHFAPELLVDYVVEFVALALAMVLFGMRASYVDRRIWAWTKIDTSRYIHLAVPVIRIGVGITLVILALHNKLLSPDMALTFLDKHDLNFMRLLGFASFDNLHFVFAGGVVELTLGVLLVLGIATRFVAVAIAGLLVTTMAILGPVELVGHLVLLGVIALLVYRGSGGYSVNVSESLEKMVPASLPAG